MKAEIKDKDKNVVKALNMIGYKIDSKSLEMILNVAEYVNKKGAKMIVERIRWETAIQTTDKSYKINNNYTALYARKFVNEFPVHKDRFNFRVIRG